MAIKYVFNPFTGNFDTISVEAAAVGGLYGINVETLTGDKTLTSNTDEIYQFLNQNGTNRTITLDTASASAGDRFIIRNMDVAHYYIDVKLTIQQNGTTMDIIWPGKLVKFIFDGTNWKPVSIGTGETGDLSANIAIGHRAEAWKTAIAIGAYSDASNNGVAIGSLADAYIHGAGMGHNCDAFSYGAALGAYANGRNSGVAIGYHSDGVARSVAVGYYADTNDSPLSVALGYRSANARYAELCMNIDEDSRDAQITIGGFYGKTTNDTPAEILCAGRANSRFTIRPDSALTFKIMVTARDHTSGDCAAYMFDGLIKRDGAGNTTMSVCNKTVTHEDDATWDCDVTADDTNEALIITVTGDADNTVEWAARLDGIEAFL